MRGTEDVDGPAGRGPAEVLFPPRLAGAEEPAGPFGFPESKLTSSLVTFGVRAGACGVGWEEEVEKKIRNRYILFCIRPAL